MAEISALLVKELREKSGAGMMDCKKALAETACNLEEAIDWLRKKGLAAAAKKAGRIAAEGLIAVITEDNLGAIVEINAETDFVGRNEHFQKLVQQAVQQAVKGYCTVDALQASPFQGESPTIEEELTRLIAVIGENMTLRRVASLKVLQGVISSYVHNQIIPGMGKIGVLVGLESTASKDKLKELGKKIAMHVAAANPQATTIEEVDQTTLERERTILAEQARASGRPEDIIQKMVEGRIRKYYEDVVLVEQIFVIDGQTKVKDVIEAASKEWGVPVKLTGFIRYALGEGIEKTQSDFAAEVQAQAKATR
ncbi:MAG: elongation factor Ts [Proteobacteria bacterium]|nr:elongation factor Ts [Pseudomonadota bacterium]